LLPLFLKKGFFVIEWHIDGPIGFVEKVLNKMTHLQLSEEEIIDFNVVGDG